MNFLAHIYLSGNNDFIKIGNFIADGIHGHPQGYHPEIIKGIIIHREIDTFTDAHPLFRIGTKRLHARYHHYAGVIMDIFYDHFLAKNWSTYCNTPIEIFAQQFYALLHEQYEILPERNKDMIPHMTRYNWLVSYASIEGIDRTLKQMDSRTKMRSGMGNAVDELKQYYSEYEEEFKTFFDEIQHHIKQKLNDF